MKKKHAYFSEDESPYMEVEILINSIKNISL